MGIMEKTVSVTGTTGAVGTKRVRVKRVGVLTAGGDSPGLNAAIRGFGKTAINEYGMELVGFIDGIRGLAENRTMQLDMGRLAGILTVGGTILGTSRDKPHKMKINGETVDMVDTIVDNYHRNDLDGLVMIGGGGTAKNALRLQSARLNILHLPKTIDNDIAHTDTSFGFSTALGIATEAVDRLHSTAHSHHRIIVVEIMGHKAGWLALGAGIAGGADVILIPEIPYTVQSVVTAIEHRVRRGRGFSVVAVAEGALSQEETKQLLEAQNLVKSAETGEAKTMAKARLRALQAAQRGSAYRLAKQLERETGLEARVTVLGYVQRGGTPDAQDRLLGTVLGGAGARLAAEGQFGYTVAAKSQHAKPVLLSKVAGKVKTVPLSHEWVSAARNVGVCLG